MSNDHITCIAKDKLGFLWVGTVNGLNRFDGRNFKVFRHDPKDRNSLPNNYVLGVKPDPLIASIKQVGEYLFCGHPDGIFRSSDRGKTWQLLLPSIGKKVFNLSVSGKVIYAVPMNGGVLRK